MLALRAYLKWVALGASAFGLIATYHTLIKPLPRPTALIVPNFFAPAYSTVDLLPIVSLASTHHRYKRGRDELYWTLNTLLNQRGRMQEIRVYLPIAEEVSFTKRIAERYDGGKLAKCINDPLVKLHFVEDSGPSSKFVYVMEELLQAGDIDRPVIVVDDDHKYTKSLVSTLMKYSRKPEYANASLGFRGWRVHSSLHWNVKHPLPMKHALKAWELNKPLRVSVLTANEAYLVKPRFFSNDLASAQQNLLDIGKMMSTSAHLVDDIWLMGNLANIGIKRFVVPLQDGTSSKDIAAASRLAKTLGQAEVSREAANDETLRMFEDAWKRENLWQDKGGFWWKSSMPKKR